MRSGCTICTKNVWEWAQDFWNVNYSGATSNGSGWESGDCSCRVRRGGSWYDFPSILRSAFRFWNTPVFRITSVIGFRIARSL